MNNTRRKALQKIYAAIEEVKSDLENIYDEEQEAFENIPENLEGSERYEAAENAVDNLDNAFSGLGEVLEYLEEAMA